MNQPKQQYVHTTVFRKVDQWCCCYIKVKLREGVGTEEETSSSLVPKVLNSTSIQVEVFDYETVYGGDIYWQSGKWCN